MNGLRWSQSSTALDAHCGNLRVGFVLQRSVDGVWVYDVTAVHTRWITKGFGEVKSKRAAVRGLERAWATWLEHAGLSPTGTPSEQTL